MATRSKTTKTQPKASPGRLGVVYPSENLQVYPPGPVSYAAAWAAYHARQAALARNAAPLVNGFNPPAWTAPQQ